MIERDQSLELTERVRDAHARRAQQAIFGSRSKSWCLGHAEGELLSVGEHYGIVEYRPEELVVTARAGTPLMELADLLAQHGQYLPFEPPRVDGGGTIGGAVASGLAGPGRPWRGSVRDAVLGVELVNGLGERLKFGGQVVKNVAGYDLSRLQAGACGTLGLLLSVSLRLLPLPETEETVAIECSAAKSQELVRRWARTALPVSATCFVAGRLHVRLSGTDSVVRGAAAEIGGERLGDAPVWVQLRDRALRCFQPHAGLALWELLCPPAAALAPDDCVFEWAGARRWWLTDRTEAEIVDFATGIDGKVLPAFGAPRFTDAMAARLKWAFDPDNILNPGIVHADPVA